ncbi:hypothetical protein GQ457_16G014820 [Hibiscus cannabinus]
MFDNRVHILELTSENFKFWKENILLQLGCLDIDYAIRKSEPSITDNSNQANLALHEKWERSNLLSIMFIKSKVPADVRGSIEQYKNVQDLLAAIEKQFQTSQKSLASTLIMKFTSLKLTTVKGVCDHINKMRDLAARLKALEVEMSNSFLVHYILNTLPPQYGSFKISYNTHKDKWSIDELLTICDQEEGRLILEMGESALTVTQGKSLFYKYEIVGNGVLCDGLYSIDLQNNITHTVVHIQTGTKRCVISEDSSTLWHQRLGHISIERIKRLVNDGVINTLDFIDFDTCVDCIKGKQTNKSKKGAKRSSTILEIIHSDICCPDMDVQGQKYFITFIDDCSRYMYLYMLHHKSEALEAFKVFKAEVEKQCGKQIKIVRTNRGGEYYGTYTDDGQVPGPFAKFLQDNESDYNIGVGNDPESFSKAMSCNESKLWYDAIKDEMNSMKNNEIWDLVALPDGVKAIGLPKKDSLRIVLALVAQFYLELQQMDVKTAFLNGDLEEEVYMKQPELFSSSDGEKLVCKLKKSIYGLKQASSQWYLKFHEVISSFGFVENIMDQCIYQKVSGSKICVLILYVNDILLATNDRGMLHEVKQFLSKNFDMKDMGDASYVIGIKIHRDRNKGVLGLSQETYINKVLERFWMKDCSPSVAPIVKGDKFNLNQCPKNEFEREQMKNIPYASVVGSLIYAQVCTRPDIAFFVGMLGRYQSNPGIDY